VGDLRPVRQLVEVLDELPVVRRDKEDRITVRSVQAPTKRGEEFRLACIATIGVSRRQRRQVADHVDGNGSSGENGGFRVVNVVRSPFRLRTAQHVPNLAAEVALPVAGGASEDHRAGANRTNARSIAEERQDLGLNGVCERERANACPTG
jgi:hypothetical protein